MFAFGKQCFAVAKVVGTIMAKPTTTDLHSAIMDNDLDKVKQLIETEGMDLVQDPGIDGRHAIHYVRSVELLRFLQSCGANVEARTYNGGTALHWASREGHLAVVQHLVAQCHANIHATDAKDRTPLELASEKNQSQVASYLQAITGTKGACSFDTTETSLSSSSERDEPGNGPPLLSLLLGIAETVQAASARANTAALHNAIKSNDMDKVRHLIERQRANVEDPDGDGWRALHFAGSHGCMEIAVYLVKVAGAKVDAKENNGLTALHCASSTDNVLMVQCLVRVCGANVEAVGSSGLTPLHVASALNNVKVVQALVQTCKANVEAIDKDGSTALHVASIQNRTDVITCLVQTCGAQVEATDHGGCTALHDASRIGHLAVVKQLVEAHSANIQARNRNGDTPLNLAQRESKGDTVSYLQSRGAVMSSTAQLPLSVLLELAQSLQTPEPNQSQSSRVTVLHDAIENNDLAMVRDLVSRQGGIVEGADSRGWRALHCACFHGSLEIAKYLVLVGRAKVDAGEKRGLTSLHFASVNNQVDIVHFLISEGRIDVDTRDNNGTTALHAVSMINSRVEMVKCLIGHWADVQATTDGGSTALHLASAKNCVDIVQCLVETCRAKVDATDQFGLTALHEASLNGHLTLVKQLVGKHGANIHAKTKQGDTPLDLAQREEKHDVVSYLHARRDHTNNSFLPAPSVESNVQLEQQNKNNQEMLSLLRKANFKLDGIAPVLNGLDVRITSPIPRLFFMVPAERRNPFLHFREFIHSKYETKYYLYFVCAHTKRPVGVPIKIHMKKQWVDKVAPVLAVSLQVLQIGLRTAGVQLNLDGMAFNVTTETVGKMLAELKSMMTSQATHSDVLARLNCNSPLNVAEIPELTGDVYDHMVDKAKQNRSWRQYMEPVWTEKNLATIWVSKEVAEDRNLGYTLAS